MQSVGVRELRQNASEYLRRVRAGERFTVTDRGTPIAELGPISSSPLQRMIDAGAAIPARVGFSASEIEPVRLPDDAPGASDVLQEMRDAERW